MENVSNNLIAIKKVGSPIEFTTTSIRYLCDMKKVIGSNYAPEPVPLGNGLVMLADEEGRMKGLKHNFYMWFPKSSFPYQTIIGTVAFVRIKPVNTYGEIYDYEIGELTKDDRVFINSIFDKEFQNKLKTEFIKRYKSEENPKNYWHWQITQI